MRITAAWLTGMLGIALALTASAENRAERAARAERVAQGERSYRRYCASCHGFGADGKGPVASVLLTQPADLTRLAQRHGSPLPRAQLAELIDGRKDVVAHGPREMPVWGERLYDDLPPGVATEAVKAGTVALILEYLETIQRK